MRNTLKKVLAAVVAAALCLSLTACYNENNTWAAKKDDETLPIGSYIYYLTTAYLDAQAEVPEDQEVVKAEIDGVNGKEWTKDRAVNYVKAYFYLKDQLQAAGKDLTEEEAAEASDTTDYMWTYYKSSFEDLGIARDSFDKAYSLYSQRLEKFFDVLYGEGGALEVSKDELESYFTENYYSYEYFFVSLSTTDEDGNSVDMSDDEKQEVKSKLDNAAEAINAGTTTVEDAATAYAEENLGEDASNGYYAPSPSLKDNLGDTIKEALDGLGENETAVAEASSGYYVIRKLPIADAVESTLEDEDQVRSLLQNMKSDGYQDYVLEQAAQTDGVEINSSALNTADWGKIVTDSNKMGTKETESEEDVSSEAE